MSFLTNFAQGFIDLLNEGASTFVGMVSGILPAALVALVFMNTIVALIGPERVENFFKKTAGRSVIIRYLVMPFLSNFFFSNPTAFMMGKYLPEKYKPGYFEAVNSLNMAPMMSLFPHVNPAELYVWLGVASGITKLGLPIGPLAIRVFFIGLATTTLKAFVIEKISNRLAKSKGIDWDVLEEEKVNYAEV
ncbi:PTS glucitol/sorbitol transporter subunit IIC [Tepidimicrobium xylanilyticum]|uniref:PTS system, glucitol/sorbitol-specific IIC component n=1 Tax=Tepidimicrobium xylanilyticum TaxID=1123352 RepID=A0A1H2W4Z4_9FIRM|nr:glucitol/sorbitol-specific PTS transporter subunit IIC [Tepidimicrobium xylanilyticum]SDW75597.1 PTS system, glucitol/sorbitol-specific IIC component [Tepidimicrobium xylanilyticum]